MDGLQQLSEKLDNLREELGAELFALMIQKRKLESMLFKTNTMREKLDLLQIEQDRREVGKW